MASQAGAITPIQKIVLHRRETKRVTSIAHVVVLGTESNFDVCMREWLAA